MGNLFSIEGTIDSFIFFPPLVTQNLDSLKLKNVKIVTKRGINIIIIFPADAIAKKYIIFSHGNGSDVFSMFSYAQEMANKLKVAFIIYDYPGYGYSRKESTEIPTEDRCYRSIKYVIKYVQNKLLCTKIEEKNIILIGQSLGTGVVIDYVSKYFWKSPIILISPYKSIATVVTESSFVQMFDKFKSLEKIKYVYCPVKIFHGNDDQVINISHAKIIYDNLNNKKLKPTWLHNIGHNDILDAIDTREIIDVINYK